MQFNELALKILIILLPGIVSYTIIQSLCSNIRKHTITYFWVRSAILGFLSNVTFYPFFKFGLWKIIPGKSGNDFKFLESLIDLKHSIDFYQVIFITAWSVIVAIIISKGIESKWFHRSMKWLNITNRFGDLDVWSYLHNIDNDETVWIRVRDIKNNLIFEGWVCAFSETYQENELFLREVKVFRNDTGEELYETPGLYIARDNSEITIEFSEIKGEG
jgi:hypothetical protein